MPLQASTIALTLLILLIPLTTLRILSLLPAYRPRPRPKTRGTPTRLLIVLGSGGHTAEMFALLRDLDTEKHNWRSYVVGEGDGFSAVRAEEFERGLRERAQAKAQAARPRRTNGRLESEKAEQAYKQEGSHEAEEETQGYGGYDISTIRRARHIHQPLLLTPPTALRCLFACFSVLRGTRHGEREYPDLILTNGPGTGVVVVLASLILRFLGPGQDRMRTVYVESWARVKGLSLSGRLLVRVVDRFVVQWEGLEGVGGRGEFLGVLV
ncbi:UDP-N-acetylglucosamine transferase subunit [Coniosporium apollinis]|uniref:UDP-N-acetylglucosamine transferase subunit ALG14 n=1 Tax=Coniosporium apollinis TaxID=61459 RepID=A0ABQ9NVQ7_9PEZI|nr:UDP-N-acetylglucosamine transferase subunit [Coniosporium apollinis]